jgi:hypothetical protein
MGSILFGSEKHSRILPEANVELMVMTRIEKWNGAGNDFIIVEDNDTISDPAAFAIEHCDE